MLIRKLLVGLLVVVGGSGCGLDVTLTAFPNPTQAGSNVTFNLGVTNRSNCALDSVEAIVDWEPDLGGVPADICSRCQDVTSFAELSACLEGIIGPAGTAQVMTGAQAVADAAEPIPAGTCSTGAFPVQCSFDPLAPLASDSVQFTALAPASGPLHYLAMAFGSSQDPNCPILPADPNAPIPVEGAVFGCALASAAGGQAAPALSPLGVAVASVLLFVTGLWGIRRSWRARA